MFQLGTFGAILEYGCTERVTDHSSLGATMVVGTTGVIIKLKLTRASQTYLMPVHLSDEVMMQPVFYGTIVPLVAWFTVKKLILDPLEARRKQEVKRKAQEATKEKVAAARKEAEASLSLMEERYTRIRAEEQSRDGLLIDQCLYGLLSTEDGVLMAEPVPGDDIIDITKPVQCCVEQGRLVLWDGAKCSLPGVWDPCPGDHDKWILVRYTYKNVTHQLFCPENEAIKLPKTSHKITSDKPVSS